MIYYIVKKFKSEAKKAGITNALLVDTADDFISMDEIAKERLSLGSGIYKVRMASNSGQGKSSGARAVLVYKKEDKIFWLHVFKKNEKENISTTELKKLKVLSKVFLNLKDNEIQALIDAGELSEVK